MAKIKPPDDRINHRNNAKSNKVQVIPLGGVGEIGKNMFVVRYEDDILILDAGIKFPDDEMLGVDVVIPDISYLLESKEKIKAIILTHGHEDHIGALPYILDKINVPIYGTKLTLGIVKVKLKEYNLLKSSTLIEINPSKAIEIASFKLQFFRTNHNIPDSIGVAVETPAGLIVYTSDFKFDQTPVNGMYTDFHQIAKLAQKGVLALLSDSTNAERPGYTLSEKEVGETINEIFRTTEGRIIIATFASNIHRIQQVFDAAVRFERKVAVIGRSMVNVVEIARELGYLHIAEGSFIDVGEIDKLPCSECVVLTTGSQGEPMSALTRISLADHRKVEIRPGDTVVISAKPIPGNEKLVSRTIDNLFRLGARVIYESVSGIHVSGHGSQEELKMMLNLLRPRYLIPVHGEYRHMIHHAQLAEKVGIPKDNILIAEIGSVLEFNAKGGRIAGRVTAGQVLVDGFGVGDVGNIVLRDRKVLSEDGIVIVVLSISKDKNEIVSGPDIITRGFVYVRESEELLLQARDNINQALDKLATDKMNEWSAVKSSIRESMGRFFWEKTGRRPMILPIIMEV
ncbi:MAG: ribonuclease J [Dethiobacteria bacterium]